MLYFDITIIDEKYVRCALELPPLTVETTSAVSAYPGSFAI